MCAVGTLILLVAGEEIKSTMRGFSVFFRAFAEFLNQSPATLASVPRHTKAQSWRPVSR
jgi:hypothetical protein